MKTRFEMIKERHKKSLKTAIKERKADSFIIPMLEFIASTKNYYTSSSCSGRIILLGLGKNSNKKDSYFHAKWHRTIAFEELMKELKKTSKGKIWLKQEPFILHIGTNTIENANIILKTMKETGIKRGGIMLTEKEKIILEIIGTQNMYFPIKEDEKILLEEKYLQYTLKEANEKTTKNYETLKKLEQNFRKKLK